MAKRTPPTYPAARRQVEALGQRLRAARLRRGLSQAVLAERVGVTVQTLGKLEAGNPTTSVATLLRVLQMLGLGDDIDRLAADDAQGHALQDSRLVRAPSRRSRA
jgi:transcriptional regulator with XRE-family HTH domain